MRGSKISLLSLALASVVQAQLPVVQLPQLTPASSGRWWPTNAPGMFLWLETVPFLTMSNQTDNSQVFRWTNVVDPNLSLAADQPLRPTNFISGGGLSGTTDKVHWQEAVGGTQRITGGPGAPSHYTFIFVANCDNAATSPGGMFYDGTAMRLEFNNAALQMSAGTTLTGPAVIGTGWYIITAVFNNASSEIDTNGVLYVSGAAGNTALGSVYLGQFQAFKGNISRVWAWTNTLSGSDMTSAINQCKTDYGFP